MTPVRHEHRGSWWDCAPTEATCDARARVDGCGSTVTVTRLGPIEHLAFGDGFPVLWVHGVLGGCDHGPAMARAIVGHGFRFIAVSRFGYLGSPMGESSTPAAQADRYAALLDALGLERAAVVGASAGGPSSLQFALRHPDRCSALVLWSAAVPGNQVPPAPLLGALARYFGSDLLQWLTMSCAPWLTMTTMGVPRRVRARMASGDRSWVSAVMWSFLPVRDRVTGVVNDIRVTNPDLNAGSCLSACFSTTPDVVSIRGRSQAG